MVNYNKLFDESMSAVKYFCNRFSEHNTFFETESCNFKLTSYAHLKSYTYMDFNDNNKIQLNLFIQDRRHEFRITYYDHNRNCQFFIFTKKSGKIFIYGTEIPETEFFLDDDFVFNLLLIQFPVTLKKEILEEIVEFLYKKPYCVFITMNLG